MKDIVVIGGGGHAKVVISILRKLKAFHVIGYTDLKDNGTLFEASYLGDDNALARLAAGHGLSAAIGVGQVGLGRMRSELYQRGLSLGLSFPSIVSPDAIVNEEVELGEGTVVMDGVVVNPGAAAGKGVIVNSGSIIEHDVVLGDWVHVAPGVTISGAVKVGMRSMVGAGAVIIEGRTIADDCMVGAGAVVIHDLIEPGVYAGCPARRIR